MRYRLTALALVFASLPAVAKKPPVPQMGTAAERVKLLLEAIRKDEPAIANPFFFPKLPFRKVKGIKDPDRYFDYLVKVYHKDVKTLRATLKQPDTIELIRFELGGWKRWVVRGKEANRLPYWAVHKSKLVVRDAGKERTLRVRVMISWEGQWYVTHLLRKTLHEKL